MSIECKYGHGSLVEQDGTWSLPMVTKEPRDIPQEDRTVMVASMYSEMVYTVKIWQCPVCGYIELFDDEAHNGGE